MAQKVKNPSETGKPGLYPRLGRSPGGWHGNPLQYSCLENPQGQRSRAGYSPWGHKESDTTEQLGIQHSQELALDHWTCVLCFQFNLHTWIFNIFFHVYLLWKPNFSSFPISFLLPWDSVNIHVRHSESLLFPLGFVTSHDHCHQLLIKKVVLTPPSPSLYIKTAVSLFTLIFQVCLHSFA